jgi:hypothetical protein
LPPQSLTFGAGPVSIVWPTVGGRFVLQGSGIRLKCCASFVLLFPAFLLLILLFREEAQDKGP